MAGRVDAVVIGMGPGGEEAAGSLAEAGLQVVGIEEKLVGGECPYWGCVPSKMMIRAANLLAEARRIPGVAGTATVTPAWAPVAQRIREQATDSWNDQVAVDRFVRKGGRFVRGHGTLLGPGRVAVGDDEFEAARAIVLNPGTSPSVPPIAGLDQTPYWTNREAIETEEVPGSITVLGGGSVGLELAQVFARFGSRVTVVEAADRLLPMEEPEASQVIEEVLRREGLELRTGATVTATKREGDAIALALEGGERIASDRLLVATGRRANLALLGLDQVGLDSNARFIPVDGRMRAAGGVWALGDATGHGAFTHVSMYQAQIATADILGAEGPAADYRALSRVTFTDPEVGSAGMTERQAREQGLRTVTGSAPVAGSARGWIHGPGSDGVIKLVADLDRGVLVGATAVGPMGGEVLSMLVLAIQAQVQIATLRRTIYAYPTFHRGVEDALRALEGS